MPRDYPTEELMPDDVQQEFDRLHEETIEEYERDNDLIWQELRDWLAIFYAQIDLRNGG